MPDNLLTVQQEATPDLNCTTLETGLLRVTPESNIQVADKPDEHCLKDTFEALEETLLPLLAVRFWLRLWIKTYLAEARHSPNCSSIDLRSRTSVVMVPS